MSANKQISDLQKQIEELQAKQESLKGAAKDDAIKKINAILGDTFTIPELYPEFKKGVFGKREKSIVYIGDEEFEIAGKMSKEISSALVKLGKNPADYNKKSLVIEFGTKKEVE